jgi:hypothetical protein
MWIDYEEKVGAVRKPAKKSTKQSSTHASSSIRKSE